MDFGVKQVKLEGVHPSYQPHQYNSDESPGKGAKKGEKFDEFRLASTEASNLNEQSSLDQS